MYNKKTNLGIILNILTNRLLDLSLTESSYVKNKDKIVKIKSLIKNYFSSPNVLSEELRIFTYITDNKFKNATVAMKLVSKLQEDASKLDSKKQQSQKIKLINEIYKIFNKDEFWKTRINAKDYRLYTAIGTMIEIAMNKKTVPTENKLMLEDTIVNYLTSEDEQQKFIFNEEVDNLTYYYAYENFNNNYLNELNKDQKETVLYYMNEANCDPENMKSYMLKGLRAIQNSISEAKNDKDIQDKYDNLHSEFFDDTFSLIETNVLKIKESLNNNMVNDDVLKSYLEIQGIVGDYKELKTQSN